MIVKKRFSIKRRLLKVSALLAVLVAFLAVVLPLSPLNAQSSPKIKFVSPEWVRSNASDPNLRVLDLRLPPIDYFTSHLPNAVHFAENTVRGPKDGLPVQYFEPAKLGDLLSKAGVTDNSRVVVYSDGANVLGASMISYILERIGHRGEVAILDGGLAGYKAVQETTKEFPKYKTGKLSVRDNPAIRVSLSQVRDLIGKPGVTFIDPRPPKAFQGEENIFTRNGHIPGARNIPWPTFTEADNQHKLKSLSDIQKILDDKKIDKSKDIIVTCTTGREATLQYVVLKHLLGYPKVRVFEGSWTEYSQSDLPVETGAEKPV